VRGRPGRGVYPKPALDPGKGRLLEYEFTCTIEGPTDPWATVQARVRAHATDPNGGNDTSSDKVELTEAP
jgi:hypothetical protein